MIGTDRSVCVFRVSWCSTIKIKDLHRRFAVDDESVNYSRRPPVLRIGDEEIWLYNYTDADEDVLDQLSTHSSG